MDIYIDKLNFDFSVSQKILNFVAQVDIYKGKWIFKRAT